MWSTIPLSWRLLGALVLAGGLFGAGVWTGDAWRQGRAAVAAQAAQRDAAQARRSLVRFADGRATQHAATVRSINHQLEAAYARIAQLRGRDCLDPGTVGVLNAVGGADVRTAASEPDAAAAAAAANRGDGVAGVGLRHSTDRDLAKSIAVCRSRYAEVSDQLNGILDIEEHRQQGR